MGRRLPAEWEPQSAVQLTWPVPLGHWGEHTLAAERVLARIALEIARREGVIIACSNADHVARRLREFESEAPEIRLCQVPANDAWARDHGGITVVDEGQPRLVNFQFNGWGGKYPADLDNRITAALHAQGVFGATTLEDADFILEGGALETDGVGTLLTTSGCLLTPSRNAGFNRSDYEQRLRQILGISRILWLDHGYLEGDDTDGHIDTLARFANEDTIVYTTCENPDEPHFDALKRMEAELRRLTTVDGRPYRLVPLPLPAPIRDEEGNQL
ncbi:MAG: agmatine deiminase family protein, partial [Candidatus Hydrogenedentes bacterium]|nr:agmatine deiminase family protein [Candidatus Hydrogenedentota bacterium]